MQFSKFFSRASRVLFAGFVAVALSLGVTIPAHAWLGNETMEDAPKIGVMYWVYGDAVKADDVGWYRFELPANGTVQFWFTGEECDWGDSWEVTLTDSSGNTIWGRTFIESSTQLDNSVIGLSAGTYFVRIAPVGSSDDTILLRNTYGFLIDYQNGVGSDNWETELNDEIASADRLALGPTVKGSATTSSDVDWYRFELPSASSIYIYFSNGEYHWGGYWLVTLMDSAGNTIESYEWSEFSTRHDDTVVDLPAGTYYVRVETPGSLYKMDGHAYELTVSTASVMHRLYNPYTGEHFYTASESERDSLRAVGWNYEGFGWIAPTSGDPVYRLFNPYTSDHHYTMDKRERDELVAIGWQYEGIGWYSDGNVPVLRQFNPYATTATHNYTVSQRENDNLVSIGWRAEGAAWYALSA